jgi:hypothetical protein
VEGPRRYDSIHGPSRRFDGTEQNFLLHPAYQKPGANVKRKDAFSPVFMRVCACRSTLYIAKTFRAYIVDDAWSPRADAHLLGAGTHRDVPVVRLGR